MNGIVNDVCKDTKIQRRVRFAENRRQLQQLKDELGACSHWAMSKDAKTPFASTRTVRRPARRRPSCEASATPMQ